MTDVRNWDRDANNNSLPPPDGAPEGQTAGSVNDCIRENMSGVKRLYDDNQGELASTGSGGAYAISSSQNDLTAYQAGLLFTFIANHANTGAATLNVNSIGAKALERPLGVALKADDIQANQLVMAAYEATTDKFQLLSIPAYSEVFGSVTATETVTLGEERVSLDWDSGEGRLRSRNQSADAASTLGFYTTNSVGNVINAVHIDSSQRVGIQNQNLGVYSSFANTLVVGDSSASSGITIVGSASSNVAFTSTNDAINQGLISYNHATDIMGLYTANTLALSIDAGQNIYGVIGVTTMTDGFPFLPASTGAPTGVPTVTNDRLAAQFYNTADDRLYIFNHVTDTWKSVALT